MTKSEVIAAIQAKIDSANQRAAGREGHEAANASWFVHGLEIALQIVEQLREDEQFAEDLQRKRFEAWIASLTPAHYVHVDIDERTGRYISGVTRSKWEAWKAALTWRATT